MSTHFAACYDCPFFEPVQTKSEAEQTASDHAEKHGHEPNVGIADGAFAEDTSAGSTDGLNNGNVVEVLGE